MSDKRENADILWKEIIKNSVIPYFIGYNKKFILRINFQTFIFDESHIKFSIVNRKFYITPNKKFGVIYL